MQKFFDIKNIKGIKYTGRDYYSAQLMKRLMDKEAIFFAGCDEQLLCGLALGNVFSGGIGTTYNIIPATFAKICALAADSSIGVLWTSHNMVEVATVCRRVLFLSHGKILLEGDPKTLPREHGKATLEDLFVTVAREPLTLHRDEEA